jgi:hypothetical protein
MTIPTFTAEASLYRSRTHYQLTGGWSDGTGQMLGLQMLGLAQMPMASALRTPIICNGSCPPPHCQHHCGPCMPNAQSSTGCGRTCTTICPGEPPDTSVSPCPTDACNPVTCGPCTGGSCGPYPTCGPIAGSGTQTCTDSHGNTSTRPC